MTVKEVEVIKGRGKTPKIRGGEVEEF